MPRPHRLHVVCPREMKFSHHILPSIYSIFKVIYSKSQIYKKHLLCAQCRARSGDMALNREKLLEELAIQ